LRSLSRKLDDYQPKSSKSRSNFIDAIVSASSQPACAENPSTASRLDDAHDTGAHAFPASWTEEERLNALARYKILDTPPETAFDDIVKLAAQVCKTPIARFSLLAKDRQWFKAEVGQEVGQIPLEGSICLTTIQQSGLFIVPDLTQDPGFAKHPLVIGQGNRFRLTAP